LTWWRRCGPLLGMLGPFGKWLRCSVSGCRSWRLKVNNLDKETIGKIISAVLTLIITLLGILGYHVTVVAPQFVQAARSVELMCK